MQPSYRTRSKPGMTPMRTPSKLTRASLSSVVAAVAVGAPTGATAQSNAWLGVTPPPGLTNPPQFSVLAGGRLAAPAVAVPASEAGDTELEGARVRALLDQIVGFSRASRAAG